MYSKSTTQTQQNSLIFQSYNVGDEVLCKNMHRLDRKGGGGGGETECRWLGPYTIAEAIGKNRYRVKNSSGMLLKKSYHCALFRPFVW